MELKSDIDEYFYSKEWDIILNSLLTFLPPNLSFNLYKISQEVNINYEDIMVDGISKVEKTYTDITNYLIYNDFVKLHHFPNVTFTDKGRRLLECGSYKGFAHAEQLRQKAEKRDLWVKKNWFWVEFLKVIITIIVGALLTLVIQYFTNNNGSKQKTNYQSLKHDTTQIK
ncbi:MAG: hypothetical protein EKK37_17900 [Sphingobacteriales bacterium]|nr:MAG: hypothetical protein EKK37_17900 [Sphingobacteriales bacterium]